MNRSDFITVGGQKIKKSEIVTYFEYNNNQVAIKTTRDIYHSAVFNGTIEEFEELLFDDDPGNRIERLCRQDVQRNSRIESLQWVEKKIPSGPVKRYVMDIINDAIVRLENGGELNG